MPLNDYTNQFFNFLAASFRRWAELLSVKPPLENERLSNKNGFSPPLDWLEKTRHIPPAQWTDFSSEKINDLPTGLTEENVRIETSAEKIPDQIRQKDLPKIATSSENIFNKSLKRQTKAGSPVLSFTSADKKTPPELPAPHATLPETADDSFPANEKVTSAAKQRFRLLPSLPISDKTPRSAVRSIAPAEILVKKAFASKQSGLIFGQRKSSDKIKRSVLFTTKKTDEQQNQIISRPISRKRALSSQKNAAEPKAEVTETIFDFSKPKRSHNFVVTPKPKGSEVSPENLTAWGKSPPAAALENPKSEQNKRRAAAGDNFVFATPPWIELSAEDPSDELMKTGGNRAEIEHLLFLEREQRGRENDDG